MDDPNYADEDPARRGEPAQGKRRYTCPHPDCQAYALMEHGGLQWSFEGQSTVWIESWFVHRCFGCKRPILWHSEGEVWTLVHPAAALGEPANPEMPDEIRSVYEEARTVAPASRRSAAALLRLALQMLVDHLEPGAGDINSKIGRLVTKGLHPQTQQAMDVLRVIGNNAVHPGQIDLDDDPELIPGLFRLANVVVEQMISIPNHANTLYNSLPAAALTQISRRDGQTAPP